MHKVLEMKEITKSFSGIKALNKVSFDLYDGEVLALCGENGAGKSTLMKILSGSYPSSTYEGSIYIDEKACNFSGVKSAQNAGIEMIYQEISLMLDLTVAENIYLGNLPSNALGFIDYNTLFREADDILNKIGLPINSKEKVRFLSTSQQQMISIVKAYVKKPKILVLDEPTSALTEKETQILLQLINGLREKSISCIYISHKLNEIFQLSDRITILRDGNTIATYLTQEVSSDELIADMVGRKIENLYPIRTGSTKEEALCVKHLTVPHPFNHRTNIVEDISFTVQKGEILGLAGLVGAGRSEILEALFKSRKSTEEEEVYLDGEPLQCKTTAEIINRGIGLVPEDRKKSGVIAALSIRENSTLANLSEISGKIFLNGKKEVSLVWRYFQDLKIKAPSIRTLVHTLSGGNQQKVVLSKWLMKDLKVLLLDEPTRGIDVGAKSEIYEIMRQLSQKGVAIIMVSSEMPELIGMCDRILVLGGGKIQKEMTQAEVTQTEIMKAAIVP